MGKCDIIPKSEAKPGDLIFFQKTYNTSGASHVGIYVGHDDDPLWLTNFLCFH